MAPTTHTPLCRGVTEDSATSPSYGTNSKQQNYHQFSVDVRPDTDDTTANNAHVYDKFTSLNDDPPDLPDDEAISTTTAKRLSMAAAIVTLAATGILVLVAVFYTDADHSSGSSSSSHAHAHFLPRSDLGEAREGALVGDDAMAIFEENGCRNRVMQSSEGTRHAGDVVVIPEYKAVYVVMVKSASESIRDKLSEDFGVTWKDKIPGVKGIPEGWRQKSYMLTPEIVRDYTFFTFVRDPATRIRSSYTQAMCREDSTNQSPPKCRLCSKVEVEVENPADVAHVNTSADPLVDVYTPTLEEFAAALIRRRAWTARSHAKGRVFTDLQPQAQIDTEDRWVDEHAQSQMFRITAVGPDKVTPVPMHFIGRVENFEADWARLMDKLGVDEEDVVKRKPPGHEVAQCDRARQRGAVLEQERMTAVRKTELKALNTVYKDDFECFGYASVQEGW